MTKKTPAVRSPHEKQIEFRRMAETYKECIKAKYFLAAYVIAFSFLEDRVMAMDIARPDYVKPRGKEHTAFKVRLGRLEDWLSPELMKHLPLAADERNSLVHAAMWNLSVFSADNANVIYRLAQKVDAARGRQSRKLKARI